MLCSSSLSQEIRTLNNILYSLNFRSISSSSTLFSRKNSYYLVNNNNYNYKQQSSVRHFSNSNSSRHNCSSNKYKKFGSSSSNSEIIVDEKKMNTYAPFKSNQSNWKSFIIYDQVHEKYLIISNDDKQTSSTLSAHPQDSAIPYGFYGFPSYNTDNLDVKLSTFNLVEKIIGPANAKSESIFFIGNLLTPFYANQLKRHMIKYYLVLVNGFDQIDLNHLTKEVFPNCKYEVCSDDLSTRFRGSSDNRQWLTTPETRRVASVVTSLKRNNLLTSIDVIKFKLEDESHIGINTPLEYAPGIESIPIISNTLIPFFSTNLIVSCDEKSALLVDPGASEAGRQHFENVLDTKLKSAENIFVFITHEHKDHWEGLPTIEKRFPHAKVIAHQECFDVISNGFTNLEKISVNGQPFSDELSKEIGYDQDVPIIDKANTIVIGKKVFDIVATPGHTSNSLCLFERRSRTLIAGDHIVGWGSGVLDEKNGNMKQYIDSTRSMIDVLKPKIALPAHGPACYDPILLLQTYINHRLAREKSILEAYRDGKTTLQDILSVVYRDIDPKLNQFAMMNIRLHLDKLKEDGTI